MEKYDKHGFELFDDTPIAIPIRFQAHQESVFTQMRRQIMAEINAMRDAEYETFEEADDFDVGDDYEPVSVYELGNDEVAFSQNLVLIDKQTPEAVAPEAGPAKPVEGAAVD